MNLNDIKETKSRGWKDQEFSPAKSNSNRPIPVVDVPTKQKRVDDGFRKWERSVSTNLEDLGV